MNRPAVQAALAAHRFGLGEPRLADVGADAQGWLLAQQGPAAPLRGAERLPDGVAALRHLQAVDERRRQQRAAVPPTAPVAMTADGSLAFDPAMAAAAAAGERRPAAAAAPAGDALREVVQGDPLREVVQGDPLREVVQGDPLREVVQADLRARLATAATTRQPFVERQAMFWSNHFTVSALKGGVRGLVGAHEREAIRPHVHGPFEALLNAAVRHAAMLRYLDNDRSAGPRSRAVARLAARRADGDGDAPRVSGLNENLAREILELHTLGVAGGGAAYGGWGGYTQADVTALARVLTGWRVPARRLADAAPGAPTGVFDAAWHEPGPKTVLGRRYREGPEALGEVLHDLALHPSTARFVGFKLARHFVADEPPPALVAALAAAWRDSDGDLSRVMTALVRSPLAWGAALSKLKTPEEFVVSTARVLGLGERAFERQPDGGAAQLGQRIGSAPSPAGWPDRADEWLGPDALWKRVEWATRVAERSGRRVDARELARASLGPLLAGDTARALERAADGPQALALLLLAPEFQRR